MQIVRDDDDELESLEAERERMKLPRREDSLAYVDMTENIEAVHIFSQVGTLAETARRTGLSIHALTKMSRQPWWIRELMGIQREQTALENVRLSKLYGETLDQIEERLEVGDTQFNRMTGDIVNVPLSADSLVKIGKMLFEHRQLVREAPTSIISEQKSNKLEDLAEKLERLGAIRSEGQIIDIDEDGQIVNKESDDGRII